MKAQADKHKLVVDESAAAVVKQIYQWAVDGKSALQTVRLLNEANVPTPRQHWFSIGLVKNANNLDNTHWQSRTVRSILTNELYTGSMVRGKTKAANHKQLSVKPEKWIRIKNTHTAIISRELFAKVQQIVADKTANNGKGQNGQYTPNLFKGKTFCGHCGGRLDRKKNHRIKIYWNFMIGFMQSISRTSFSRIR